MCVVCVSVCVSRLEGNRWMKKGPGVIPNWRNEDCCSGGKEEGGRREKGGRIVMEWCPPRVNGWM